MTWQGSTRRARLPNDWPQRRQLVLERDGYRCTHLTDGVRCAARATDVDHVHRGDDHSYANLASLCGPHHRAKTAAEAAAARSPRRQAEQHPGLR